MLQSTINYGGCAVMVVRAGLAVACSSRRVPRAQQATEHARTCWVFWCWGHWWQQRPLQFRLWQHQWMLQLFGERAQDVLPLGQSALVYLPD